MICPHLARARHQSADLFSPFIRLVVLFAAALLIGLSGGTNCAGAAPVPPLPATFDLPAIDRYIEAWRLEKGVVGLSVAIVRDGQIVHSRGYGAQSVEGGVAQPIAPDTRFAIGSVTKQFTCAAAFLLAEDGKLSVHDKVSKYYPALTRAEEITLLDLMNHVSGYPDYYPLDFVDRRMTARISPDELLRQYAGAKLDFDPGSNYSYSNTGYILLGRIIERVSGEPLGAFLDRRIFQPLGMTNTVYEPESKTPRLARGYTTFALSDPEPVATEASGWLGAAGGIYSTPTDLARWDLALISGRVLRAESYQLMTAPRILKSGRQSDYGAGLGVRTQAGRPILSHSGAVSGFNAWNGIIPSTHSAVIMLCNLDGGLGSLPSQIFALLLQEPTSVPKVAGSSASEVARELFSDLQSGRVDRRRFTADFNEYLSDDRIAGAARRLKPFGKPDSVEQVSTSERGGLEVSVTRLRFKKQTLRALMYRRPDGIVEQFFVSKE